MTSGEVNVDHVLLMLLWSTCGLPGHLAPPLTETLRHWSSFTWGRNHRWTHLCHFLVVGWSSYLSCSDLCDPAEGALSERRSWKIQLLMGCSTYTGRIRRLKVNEENNDMFWGSRGKGAGEEGSHFKDDRSWEPQLPALSSTSDSCLLLQPDEPPHSLIHQWNKLNKQLRVKIRF